MQGPLNPTISGSQIMSKFRHDQVLVPVTIHIRRPHVGNSAESFNQCNREKRLVRLVSAQPDDSAAVMVGGIEASQFGNHQVGPTVSVQIARLGVAGMVKPSQYNATSNRSVQFE